MIRHKRNLLDALLFLAPSLMGVLAFVVFPVVFSLVMALTNWDLVRREPFRVTGLVNFQSLLWGDESRNFWKYFINTIYLMMGLPLNIAGSLFLAMLISRPIGLAKSKRINLVWGAVFLVAGTVGSALLWSVDRRDSALAVFLLTAIAAAGLWVGPVFFRTLFYLPQITSGVAIYILWRNLFNPDFGLVNHAVHLFTGAEMELPRWLLSVRNLWGLDPEHFGVSWRYFGLGARDALNLLGFWAGIGGANCLLYLAGLSQIPTELYEVADIDGAGPWTKFRYVTWPQLAPTTFFIVIISLIGGLQGGFEQARTMTTGGPAGTTITLGYYLYLLGFGDFRLGLACALAWIMFLVIFTLTLVNWRFGNQYANL